VSEMVVESLAHQAEALSEESGWPFEEAFGDLADGPHRHERAAEWQAGLLADREAQRPTPLRTSEGGHEVGESRPSWLGRYMA
jgi:hypothetical protein